MRLGGLVRSGAVIALGLMLASCESGLTLTQVLSPDGGTLKPNSAIGPQSKLSGYSTENGLLASTSSSRERFQETEARGSGQFIVKVEPAQTINGQDGITLNLVNVPVTEAAKTILGDTLGLKYTVDERVAGNITLQTSSPVAKEALVDAFSVVLRTNGAVIVPAGDIYSIVPAAGAQQIGTPLVDGSRPRPVGVQAQIVTLQNVSPSEIQRLVEPIVHQGAILKVDDARSLLVITGTPRELADVGRIVKTFDVDWMRGMSIGLYPVRTSDPESVARELNTVFGLDKNGPLKGIVRILPNQRLGSVLVVSSKPQHLDTAREWISKLDKAAEESEKQLFVYQIENRPAGELAALLRKVLTPGGEGKQADQEVVAPRFEPDETTSQASKQVSEVGSETRGISLSDKTVDAFAERTSESGAAEGSERRTSQVFQADGVKVVADSANNALIIEALPKQYERIARILKRLDIQPIQVMLEAVIAEVTLNDELRFGVKWYFEHKKSSFTFTDALNGVVASQFPGFSYLFAVNDVRIALDALSGITNVKVVSAPSLLVMDNRRATLQIGDQVPIVTQTAQSVTDPNSPVVNAVELKDTGVILAVTPRVNESGRVILDVEQEVSNVKRTTSSGIDSPTIQQRRVKTTVSVLDGEVVALGGLIQQSDSLSKTQIPLLGDLPVVGSAFRVKETTIDRTELVIFLRPVVVRDEDEARQVTEEFQSRINIDKMSRTRGDRHFHRDADRILR